MQRPTPSRRLLAAASLSAALAAAGLPAPATAALLADSSAGSFPSDSATADGMADPSTACAHGGSPWGIGVSFDGGGEIRCSSPFNVLASNDLGLLVRRPWGQRS